MAQRLLGSAPMRRVGAGVVALGLTAFGVAPLADAAPSPSPAPGDGSASGTSATPASAASTHGSTTSAPKPAVKTVAVTPNFGFQKVRVGVQVKSGAWVPPGTTTAGTTVAITVSGPSADLEALVNGTSCQTLEGTESPGSSETFCQFGQVATVAQRSHAIAQAAAARNLDVNPADLSTSNDYLAFPGDTVTFTQTTVNDGLVIDAVPQTVGPCVLPLPQIAGRAAAAEPSAEFPPCPSSDAFNSVTFNDAGLPPTAVDDTASVVTGHSATLNVVANDDTHGAPDSITAVTQPAHGQVSIVPTVTALAAAASVARPNAVASPTDEVRFTPDAGFIGTTTFTYTLTTPNGSSTATVTVDVLAPPPTAVDDAATTPENQAVTVHVTANDSANGGGALTLNSATDPAHGSVALSGLNVVYTPDQSFVGTDSFTYRISTPFGSTTATVTVTVTAANVLAATGPSATQALDIAFLLLLSGGGVLFAARRRVLPAHR